MLTSLSSVGMKKIEESQYEELNFIKSEFCYLIIETLGAYIIYPQILISLWANFMISHIEWSPSVDKIENWCCELQWWAKWNDNVLSWFPNVEGS